MEREGEREKEK
jgi:hypothetical protein